MLFSLLAKAENISSTLRLATDIPLWVFATIGMVVLIWIYSCYKNEVACSSNLAKSFLGFLRILIFAALLLMLCEPVWEQNHYEEKKSHVLFLVDTSLSMNIEDRYSEEKEEERKKLIEAIADSKGENIDLGKVKRIEIANRLLQNSKRLKALEDECNLFFFKFDTVLGKASPLEASIEAKGQKTNIYDHVKKAIDSQKGRTISAIYVLSDGQHNTGKLTWDKVAEYAETEEVPIYTVGIGSTDKKRDIMVTAVEAPEVALVDDQVPFEVEIKNVGYEGQEVPVEIKWGETILAEKTVKLEKEGDKQKVIIPHTFHTPGDYSIKVSVPVQYNEFSQENNVRQHNIRVIEEKFRILYLEGTPRWEYRYLKNALIRDQTVLANTWLYDADRDFPQEKSLDAQSLGGFPSKEELLKYHCVIIGDVPLKQITREQRELLVEYVKDHGGGVVFISGEYHNPREYWDSELSPLLPVFVDVTENNDGPFDQENRVSLTPEGKRHRIMRLLPNIEDNQQLWENDRKGLPGFYWFFPVEKPKPGATVLAVNRSTKNPLFLTQIYGKGKTFFTALDSSWRWRYLHGDRYFYRFWGQVVRHVSMGILVGSGRQYTLSVDETDYIIGDIIDIRLKIVDNQNRRPIEQKEWKISYRLPSGEEKEKILKSTDKEPGVFEGNIIATQIGEYAIWIDPPDKDKIISTFRVQAPLAESGKPQLNEKDLRDLAKRTRGDYLKPHEFEKSLEELKPQKEKINLYVETQSLLDKDWIVWVFLAILVLFTLEWVVRKSMRLL